mgnify:CR=1 FL=1
MEQNKALQLLVEAVGLAQKRGAYSLDEIAIILPAIRVFTVKKEEVKEEVEEEKVISE